MDLESIDFESMNLELINLELIDKYYYLPDFLEIRYSKIKDFNNTVIKNYYKNKRKFKVPNYNKRNYIRPYFDR